jgi:proteasome lid subunit RPN8/RPN11
MIVQISRAVLDGILAAAAADPAREVCGLMVAEAGTAVGGTRSEGWQRDPVRASILAAQPTANVAADPTRRFEIDPAALFAAIRAERGGGARLVGHYHSHPSGEATPSLRDAAMADQPGRLWLIVAAGAARCWVESPGGSVHQAFEPCSLRVEDGCA